MMYKFESELIKNGYKLIAGVDEVGRGCIAGPLVVAICVLPLNYKNNQINDSKQLTFNQRQKVYKTIINDCLYYDYIILDAKYVDENNPKQSSINGMIELINRAISNFNIDSVLIDYEKINNLPIKNISITKGDQLSISIAASSIIAKVIRDEIMIKIDNIYPEYDFKNNKGYLTKKHLNAINKFKPIKNIHRFSYKPIKH